LIVQPLVENSIRHGLSRKVGPCTLRIRASRSSGQLVIEVADNGVGLPAAGAVREGIGLSNTRARLRGLYGDEAALTLDSDPDKGVVATVTLPYRTDAGSAVDESPRPRSAETDRTSEALDEVAGARR
jgi:LytS/YehU family sensor histidine kinase